MHEIIGKLKPNAIVKGPVFSEPVQIIMILPMGDAIKLFGKGLNTGQVHEPILYDEHLSCIEVVPEKGTYSADPVKFRLGIEAIRLGIAYEYDPYFTLSIARVDPLPHQLEAVYDYFLKLPRIRFLLADDPGAGKTVMAGLLIKELKIRGLIKRILIITPANLSFQWQREMKDKFREQFEVIKSDVLRANYGVNPWQDKNQVITSVSWVSRVDDANESLKRSHWDLVIVDEAHKMSAYSADKKTLAYKLGEELSDMTDHYLLMTATPHKGDPENFCLFLRLLDKDIYGDVKSLDEAIYRKEAPFYLRRVKEALVSFPEPETGIVKALFTKRMVQTIPFEIDGEEFEFYDALTVFVEDQAIKASHDNTAKGRALGFTMAMLQRRFASSIYAVRKTLERMKEKREKILADPNKYRYEQIMKKVPEDFDELPEEEQDEIISQLEEIVASVDPMALKDEIVQLSKLISMAKQLEAREVESKLVKLKEVIAEQGIFQDPKMKVLIFTEHKETLDYLANKLGNEWGLKVTQIHGGMKIGDRDTPGTRIYAEREFKEDCQVLIATEAAGEGINLQFCWFMINYDIPWNPVRLEQRMGRIHRYGQEKDCLILNFVSTNTREGRVLHKLFERVENIEKDLDPKQTGKVFNVLGDIFPATELERMIREMYARNQTEKSIIDRIVKEVDIERFKNIAFSTLEGLAKRELNLSSILGKTAEARERRLVPEVIEDFFIQSSSLSGIIIKEISKKAHIYRVGKIPRSLWALGYKMEPRYGKLGKEYKHIVFDKKLLTNDPTLDWVTPGHPLFECTRENVLINTQSCLKDGTVFYDLHAKAPYRLDIFKACIRDGRNNILHQRLFAVQINLDSTFEIKQPTVLLDLAAAPIGTSIPDDSMLPNNNLVELALVEKALNPFLKEISIQRVKETEIVSRHLEVSLNELINRLNLRLAEYFEKQQSGDESPNLSALIKQTEDRIEELVERLERRRTELAQERNCKISDVFLCGSAWVLPHPERLSPRMARMVRDEEIERIAVDAVIKFEKEHGFEVVSVEKENRGFDLISRKSNPEGPETAMEVKFIEVKGRAGIGEVALTTNEYKTAERLKKDYWLYVVYNCATTPEIHRVQDPACLNWESIVKVEHYQLGADKILEANKV